MTRHLIDEGCPIEEVNVGGGLGVPAREDERAIDLDAYAAVIARHLGPLGVAVGSEPGDYIAKDTAILLGEVVTVEERGGTTFVGLDIGWNVNSAYFIYRFAQEIVLCRAADAPRTELVTVAGHINEGGDVFATDYLMPVVREGDVVALLNAGGYHQAMASTHCLRPTGVGALPPALGVRRRRPGRPESTTIRMSGPLLERVGWRTAGTSLGGPRWRRCVRGQCRDRLPPGRRRCRRRRIRASASQSSSHRSMSTTTSGWRSISSTRASMRGSSVRFGFSSIGV